MKLIGFSMFLMVLFGSCFGSLSAQERFKAQIEEFAKNDADNPPPKDIYLFTGSSSVRMWKTLQEDLPEKPVLNRGFGGSTFSDLNDYVEQIIFAYSPKVIFVYEGDNDLSGENQPKEVMEDAQKFMTLLRAKMPEMPVVFISPKPSLSRWEKKDKYLTFNKMLTEFAEKQYNTYYMDVWTPMTDEKGEVFKDIFLEDNLHMNAKGYTIWKEETLKMLDSLKL